jgi:hypothetical protein
MHEHSQNNGKGLYYNVILWFVKKYSLKVTIDLKFSNLIDICRGGADLVSEPIMIQNTATPTGSLANAHSTRSLSW